MTGTPSQIEWAVQIRPRVGEEFDRVAKAFAAVAAHQRDAAKADTLAIICLVEEKRAEIMAHEEAGYYIRDWQELGDQVRQMVGKDPRYQAIVAGRKARKDNTASSKELL